MSAYNNLIIIVNFRVLQIKNRSTFTIMQNIFLNNNVIILFCGKIKRITKYIFIIYDTVITKLECQRYLEIIKYKYISMNVYTHARLIMYAYTCLLSSIVVLCTKFISQHHEG